MSWQTPFEVIDKVGDIDYHIQVPGQGRHLSHVNLLKGWQEREDPGLYNAKINWDEEGRIIGPGSHQGAHVCLAATTDQTGTE